MVVGLYMALFGAYVLWLITIIVGIIAWLIIGMIVVFNLFAALTSGITDIQIIIVICVSAALGILFGILMIKFEIIFHITLGNLFNKLMFRIHIGIHNRTVSI